MIASTERVVAANDTVAPRRWLRRNGGIGLMHRGAAAAAVISSGAPMPFPPPRGLWVSAVLGAGAAAAALSRRLGIGGGMVVGGRVALTLCPDILARLAAGRQIVLVTGTNGKTTTSHLIVAALRTAGAVAHNASGANMPDGAVAALALDPAAPVAVLEVDELHLAEVAARTDPAVIVLLNLTRDQLDRGNEVRSVAGAVRRALLACPDATVVANCDDPMVVWAAHGGGARTIWTAVGGAWSGDARTCPRCGRVLTTSGHSLIDGGMPGLQPGAPASAWQCSCGFSRPAPTWQKSGSAAATASGLIPMRLRLPGAVNIGNAVMAMAAVSVLGIAPHRAARAMATVESVVGRYTILRRGDQELRLLLVKNPAGFAEVMSLLQHSASLLVVINARDADGRDTSWLWDVDFDRLSARTVVASGERAADLGVRLSYAGIDHGTVSDPVAALALLPAGPVDVVANYTAFRAVLHRLSTEERR